MLAAFMNLALLEAGFCATEPSFRKTSPPTVPCRPKIPVCCAIVKSKLFERAYLPISASIPTRIHSQELFVEPKYFK